MSSSIAVFGAAWGLRFLSMRAMRCPPLRWLAVRCLCRWAWAWVRLRREFAERRRPRPPYMRFLRFYRKNRLPPAWITGDSSPQTTPRHPPDIPQTRPGPLAIRPRHPLRDPRPVRPRPLCAVTQPRQHRPAVCVHLEVERIDEALTGCAAMQRQIFKVFQPVQVRLQLRVAPARELPHRGPREAVVQPLDLEPFALARLPSCRATAAGGASASARRRANASAHGWQAPTPVLRRLRWPRCTRTFSPSSVAVLISR